MLTATLGRLLKGSWKTLPALAIALPALLFVTATPSYAMPDTPYSWYIYTNSPTSLYNDGCAEANGDNIMGQNSMVILDFGTQTADGSGQIEIGGIYVSNGNVIALAENFIFGYNNCSPQHYMWLDLGTNNSVGSATTYGNGQVFGNAVNTLVSYASGSRVSILGANDIESWSGGAAPANMYNWYNGYASVTPWAYVNYGSADGCPLSLSAGCSYGWQQGDYYNLSWGNPLSMSVPEVYYFVNAQQWSYISQYGSWAHGAIQPWGPLDEYDLDPSTDTPAGSWNQLSLYFPSLTYSLEMHNLT